MVSFPDRGSAFVKHIAKGKFIRYIEGFIPRSGKRICKDFGRGRRGHNANMVSFPDRGSAFVKSIYRFLQYGCPRVSFPDRGSAFVKQMEAIASIVIICFIPRSGKRICKEAMMQGRSDATLTVSFPDRGSAFVKAEETLPTREGYHKVSFPDRGSAFVKPSTTSLLYLQEDGFIPRSGKRICKGISPWAELVLYQRFIPRSGKRICKVGSYGDNVILDITKSFIPRSGKRICKEPPSGTLTQSGFQTPKSTPLFFPVNNPRGLRNNSPPP